MVSGASVPWIWQSDKVCNLSNILKGKSKVQVLGADVRELAKPAGVTFSLNDIGQALELHKPKFFFVTHAESSTGGLQGLEGIGPLCKR